MFVIFLILVKNIKNCNIDCVLKYIYYLKINVFVVFDFRGIMC